MNKFPGPLSILIVGAESILALPVIRSLGSIPEAKLHTLSAQKGNLSISECSRFITSRHKFGFGNKERVSTLLSVIKETGADILLPVEEEYVRWISFLRSHIKQYVELPPLPSVNLFNSLVYKNSLSRLLEKYYFPSATVYSISNKSSFLNNIKYPCLLKPIRGSSGNGIKKINNRRELIRNLDDIDVEKFILQEFIPGEDFGCSLLAVEGELKAFTIQRKIDGQDFGVATTVRFTENEEIADYIRRLIQKTGYSGWANLDFRLDDRDGQMKLIDFNARFWFCMSGSRAAGVDFSRLICGAALQDEIECPPYQHITWHMGRSSFRYYWEKLLDNNGKHNSNSVRTDLWERIKDPMPEIVRYLD